jgi:hypothetical protein
MAETARQHLGEVNKKSAEMVRLIYEVKSNTASAESLIKDSCSEIKRLDIAKKNITFSITSLKRLIMLSKFNTIQHNSYRVLQFRASTSSVSVA